MKTKCLAIGIILLFVGTCAISSVPAKTVNGIIYENNNQGVTFTFVGFIKDKNLTQLEEDRFNVTFTCILVFCCVYLPYNESRYFDIFHYPEAYRIPYCNYTGIFNEHFVCAKFYW